MHVFTLQGDNDQFNELTVQIVQETAKLDKKNKAHFHTIGDEDSNRYGVKGVTNPLLKR